MNAVLKEPHPKEFEQSLRDLADWLSYLKIDKIVFASGGNLQIPEWFRDLCRNAGIQIEIGASSAAIEAKQMSEENQGDSESIGFPSIGEWECTNNESNAFLYGRQMIEAIRQLAAALPLDSHYTWEVPIKNLPLDIPENIVCDFERNVFLKNHLAPVLADGFRHGNLTDHYWVICEWGKIRTFQVDERNNRLIREFHEQLAENRLSRSTFNVISSLSKLAAFWSPNQYSVRLTSGVCSQLATLSTLF